MGRFDRYILSRLTATFGFFTLVLVLVYWVNRAVVLFDQLIADGQSAGVFLELTFLSLPMLINGVLPITAFGAAVWVTNRLSSDSELVVVQATGFSPLRLSRAVIVFGFGVTLLCAVLAHVLLPRAAAQLALREADIARNATARLFRDGQFMTPSQGVAIYIREVTPAGELVDLFLSDRRDPAVDLTYTAARAYVVRTAAGPQLVMRDGMVQALDRPSGRLAVTTFADLAFDASALADATARTGRTARELSTAELLFPTPALAAETGMTEGELVVQGHYRFSDGLLAMVGAVVGFATLLVGGFSRFGVWRQILAALGVMIGVKLVEAVMVALVREMPALWAVLYVPAGLGMATAAGLLWAAGRPGLLRRRRARAVAA